MKIEIEIEPYVFFILTESFDIPNFGYQTKSVGLYRNGTKNYYVVAPKNGIITSYDDLLNDYSKRKLNISPQVLSFMQYEICHYGEYYNKAWQKYLKLVSLK